MTTGTGTTIRNGSSRSDTIIGRTGSDLIQAGAGDDVIDGGAGDDIVNGDAGNDIAVYRWSENKVGSGTSSDVYSGGTGRDTLRLVLTRAEWMDTRLQADIAAYLAFLAANTAAASGEAGAGEFRFSAFNLRAASFEKLEVVVDGVSIDPRNEAARLGADAVSVGENGGSATVNVLANDDIPDLVRSVAFTQAAGGTVKLVSLDLSDPDCDPAARFSYTADAARWQYLAAGQTATDSFTYTVTDADGQTTSQVVTVTVVGSNDGPLLQSGTGGRVVEAAAQTGSAAVLGTQGSLAFSDVDLADTHTASARFAGAAWTVDATGRSADALSSQAQAVLGQAFAVALTGDSTGGGAGTLGWSFSAADRAFDFLGAGESITARYVVTLSDRAGGSSLQEVSVTIAGANDAPVISGVGQICAGTERSGFFWNPVTTLSAEGTVFFADVDARDTHGASATFLGAVSPDGAILPSTLLAGLPGAFRATLSADSTRGATGAVAWDFDLDAKLASFLGRGQHLLLTYEVAVRDASGSVARQPVSVLITGTGGTPDIEAGMAGARLSELAGVTNASTPLSAGGSLTLGVTDCSPLAVSHLEVAQWSGGTVPSASLAAFQAALSVDASRTGWSSARLDWAFRAPDSASDFLAAGETLTLVYRVGAIDQKDRGLFSWVAEIADRIFGKEDADSQLVTITIAGTNDAPVITSAVQAGGVTEDVPALASASGTIAFTDVDLRDGHTATFAPAPGQTALGAFALTPVSEAANAASGTLAWSYQINPAAAQALAAGETRTEVYAVTVSDGNGGTATQAVTITVTGTNDAPVITSAAQAGGVTEDAPALASASGTIAFTDVDLRDGHTASFAPAPGQTALGAFALTPVSEAANAASGTLAWSYQINPAAAQFLAAGETRTKVYAVTVSDGNGGTATQAVTITITGTNDAPVAVADTNAGDPVVEAGFGAAGDALAVGNVLQNDIDVDILDTKTVTTTGNFSGSYGTLVLQAGGAYTYTLNNADGDTQALRQGQVASDVFTYTMRDTAGATSTATLTIAIAGTNDAPVVTGAVTGAATEDGAAVSLAALANASDVDGGAVLSVVGVPATLPAGVSYNAMTRSFTLDPANAAYQSLEAGGTTTVSVSYGVSDGTVTTPASVSWTVTGTNDAPSITSAAQAGSVTEDVPALTSASGTIAFTDVDLRDGHTATFLPAPGQTALGAFALTPVSEAANAAAGTLGWSYQIDPAAAQFLAAGETRTEVYAVTVSDGNGGTAQQAVTITITGTNDAPSIGAGDFAGVIAESGVLSDSGTIAFTDADDIDILSASTDTAQVDARYRLADGSAGQLPADRLADLSAGFSITQSGTNDGSIAWTYSRSEAALDFLAEGETVELRFPVSVTDLSGATTTRTVSVTIAGANDRPVIYLGLPDGGTLTEFADGSAFEGVPDRTYFDDLRQGGAYNLYDFDLSDSHTASAVSLDAGNLGWVTTSAVGASVATGSFGPVWQYLGATWTYHVDDADLDYLAAGETRIERFRFAVTDDHAGSDGRDLAITLVGANDGPTFGAADTTGVVTEAGTPTGILTDTGLIAFSDVDLRDSHIVSTSAVGTTLGNLAAQITADTTGVGSGGQLAWTYAVDAAAVEYLAAGQTRVERFTVSVDDGQGGVALLQVEVVLTGTNDAPVITSAQAPYQIGERAGPMTASGQITFFDVDAGDVPAASLSASAITVGANLLTGAQAAALAEAFSIAPNGAWNFSADGNAFQSLPQDGIVEIGYTVSVRDAAGAEATQIVTIRLAGDNDGPVAVADTNAGDPVVEAGFGGAGDALAAGNVLLNDGDVDVFDTKTVTTTGSLAGTYGTLVLQADGSYAYTLHNADGDTQALRQGQSASDVFAYTMRDAAGATSTSTLTIAVAGANDAPVVTGAVTGAVVEDGAPVVLSALANASDVDAGTVLQVVGLPALLPAGVSFDAATQRLTLDPANAAYQGLGAGAATSVSVSYGVFDGAVTVPASASWTIMGTNDAPVVSASGASVAENAAGALVGTFTVADVDTAAGLTFRVLDGATVDPRFVVVPASGTVLGQPGTYEIRLGTGQSLDFEAENADGQPTIARTIEANDGQGSNNLASTSFTVTVTDVPEAPTASDDTFATNEDVVLTLTTAEIVGNDINPPGAQPLTITGVSNPVGGTVQIVGGNVVFTPAANVSGTAGFDYTLANGAGTDAGHVTVNVAPVADAPVVTVPGLTRVSTASDGTQGNSGSDFGVAISADGRKVAFASFASNLVAGDTNGAHDIFVKDLTTGVTTRVSTASSGIQANSYCVYKISLSADGSKVAFASLASNLVAGDTNSNWDIFVKDLATGVTMRVSTALGGTQADGTSFSDFGLSADGTKIAFCSSASNIVAGDTNNSSDIFIKDLVTGITTRVSTASNGGQANGSSFESICLSADGTTVAFTNEASNLVAGDTNGVRDIFVKDLMTGMTTRVSTASNGTQGNLISEYGLSLSADGKKVAFASLASNLIASDTNVTAQVVGKPA